MAKKDLIKVSAIILILLVAFLPPFVKYERLRYKNKELGAKIRQLKEESKRMEEEKRRLQTDIVYIEGRAREKMGVARKGEIVLKESPEGAARK